MRRLVTVSDRVEIALRLKAGGSLRRIAEHVGRDVSVVSRGVARNSTKTRGYLLVHAQCAAEHRRRRPQEHKVARDRVLQARILKDLGRSRTPGQIAGRWRAEAHDPTLECVSNSIDADGRTVSHEAIYQYIYALNRPAKPSPDCSTPTPLLPRLDTTRSLGTTIIPGKSIHVCAKWHE